MTNLSSQQVLVHLDSTRALAHRLAAARELAHRLQASLAALYAATPVYVAAPYPVQPGAGALAEAATIDTDRRAQAQQVFDAVMDTPGPVAGWAHVSAGPAIGAFVRQALFADLLVLGQHDAADPASGSVPPDFVPAVLAESGRPALVVPHLRPRMPLADTIVIAWKPARECARAVSAALPLLRQARQVHVLTFGEEAAPEVSGSTLDLDRYLALHGVEAQWHEEPLEPASVGELLLERAAGLQADLLVMGCYGHSRAREWVLGGATRSVLRAMTMPVLMAH